MYKTVLLLSILSIIYSSAVAKQATCSKIIGKIIWRTGEPVFKFIKSRKYSTNNYLLTRTQFFIRSQNGQEYKIVLTNLCYRWLTAAQAVTNRDVGITANMRHNYPVGSDVVACGKLFKQRGQTGLYLLADNANPVSTYLSINGSYVTDNKQYSTRCTVINIK